MIFCNGKLLNLSYLVKHVVLVESHLEFLFVWKTLLQTRAQRLQYIQISNTLEYITDILFAFVFEGGQPYYDNMAFLLKEMRPRFYFEDL